MEELILNGEYTYTDLMSHAHEKWLVQYYGDQNSIIGETFLVFKPFENIDESADVSNEAVLSFMLSGYTTQGIFRLIYKYIG